MEIDFRVDAAVFTNPKIQRLFRRFGDLGFTCLMRLWAFTRQHRPNGILVGLDDEGIATAAGWPAERETEDLVRLLSELTLIEKSDDGVTWQIHDWHVTNPWSSGAEGRAKHAQGVNHRRWHVARNVTDLRCSLCVALPEADVSKTVLPQSSVLITTDNRTESDEESSVPNRTVPKKKDSLSEPSASDRIVAEGKRGKKGFADDSREMRAAKYLLDQLKQRNPDFTTPNLHAWAEDFDGIFRLDGRDPALVADVIAFVVVSENLSQYMLSPGALRKTSAGQWKDKSYKFDTFVTAMRRRQGSNSGERARRGAGGGAAI